MKEQYDKEGVEFIEDESQMEVSEEKNKLQQSKRGIMKPGGGSGRNVESDRIDMNMGEINDNQKNPFNMLFKQAQSMFKD